MPIKFSWLLNGRDVKDVVGVNIGSFGKKTSFLGIDSLSEEQAGNYTCIAENQAGSASYTSTLIVKGTVASCFVELVVVAFIYFSKHLTVLPKLLPFTFGDQPASLGESTTVQCSISLGDLPVKFSWLLNNQTLENIDGINIVQLGKKTSVLSIDSLTEIHAGNYTCLATNHAGTTKHHAQLVVNGKYLHALFLVPPQIIPFEFLDDPINSGDMSSLTCTVSKGDLPINITWTLNGNDVEKYGGVSVVRTNKRISQLSIDSASADHSGEYVCVAKNSAGTASHSSILHVNGKIVCGFVFMFFRLFTYRLFSTPIALPKIQPFEFGDEPSFLGDSASVQCYISAGDIPVNFTWQLNNSPVSQINGITVATFGKRTSVLTIDSLSENHAGNYSCLVTNRAGMSAYSAELIVKGIYFHSNFFFCSATTNHSFYL